MRIRADLDQQHWKKYNTDRICENRKIPLKIIKNISTYVSKISLPTVCLYFIISRKYQYRREMWNKKSKRVKCYW